MRQPLLIPHHRPWGHVTIKMSGHPPFGAQSILTGPEYVAGQARAAGIAFSQAGNCFTAVADPAGLDRIADALSQHAAVGRLSQVCQRWIYTACLCFGLDLDEQQRSSFRLRVRRLSGRIQPQPDLRPRGDDATRLRHRGGPGTLHRPFPTGAEVDTSL
jgi:hypothetical protein